MSEYGTHGTRHESPADTGERHHTMSFLGARGMKFYFCQRCYDLTRIRIEAVTPNVVSWLFDVLSWYSRVCVG